VKTQLRLFSTLVLLNVEVDMKSRAIVFITLISLALFNAPATVATNYLSAAKVVGKPTPLLTMAEVFVYDPTIDATKVTQIKLSKSNSYAGTVKVGQVFQLLVTGLWPNLIATPTVISPKGLSENLVGGTPDLDGVLAMPYLAIKKKGTYSILIRQPEEPKLSYVKVKVS
jgi:hypothetical protein